MVYEEDDNDGETIIRQIAQGDSKTIMRMRMTRMRMKIKRIMMITLMVITVTIGMMI